MFKISLSTKKLKALSGKWTQRIVEYPWVLSQLNKLKGGSLVLDVGCSESLFDQNLVKKYRVVGMDLRDNEFPNKHIMFIKRNVMDTKLPSGLFDAVLAVSTIEHVGLDSYGQKVKDTNGDIRALNELARLLKKDGKLILTTPYIGRNQLYVDWVERRYNADRLKKLIQGLKVVREDYFFPRQQNGLTWQKMSKERADTVQFHYDAPGIACLVLSAF